MALASLRLRVMAWRGVYTLLEWRIYGGIYSDMAGGAARGIIWRGRFTGVNRGAGARF